MNTAILAFGCRRHYLGLGKFMKLVSEQIQNLPFYEVLSSSVGQHFYEKEREVSTLFVQCYNCDNGTIPEMMRLFTKNLFIDQM